MSFFWFLSLLLSITLVSASWKESYNTIDGSPEVILVVEPPSIDLIEMDSELSNFDLMSLPYCSYMDSSELGTTPCRDRPNVFTSIDYDPTTDTFHAITDRGPVVDCFTFPGIQNENNSIGVPEAEGVYVPLYTPVVFSYHLDGSSFSNADFSPVFGVNMTDLTGLAQTSAEGTMFGPECTAQPSDVYPLAYDPSGVSPSSIRQVVTSNGTYYVVVEEYGPSVLVLDSDGQVLKSYVPKDSPSVVLHHGLYPVSASLPSILLDSQISRSFSALAYDATTSTFYVFVEAPLGTDQATTFIRVLRLNGTDLMNITYTGMYGFLLETASHFIMEGGSTSQLPLISVIAADFVSAGSFLTVERPLVSHPTSTFIHLDLSNATNLKDSWDTDLRLEQISANNNALLLDNEPLNDKYMTNFAKLNPPVYLGFTEILFNSQQVRPLDSHSLDGEQVSSVRVISDTVIAVGTSNNWGYTETTDNNADLFFVRLGASSTEALVNSAPVVGPAGNALTLSDSSSPDSFSQRKQWAYIEDTEYQWDTLGSVFTIEMWFWWLGGSQISDFQPIISRATEPTFESAHFVLGVGISGNLESGSIRAVVGCSSAVGFDLTGTTISTDGWHHVAFVVNGNSAQLFVDGVSSSSSTWSSDCAPYVIPYNNDRRVNLGNFESLGVNGVIDELRFWSSARTSEQIEAWMNLPLSGSETGLVAYYQFNDVPNTQMGPWETQYLRSTGPANGPIGVLEPMPEDKSRFVASTVDLLSMATLLGVDSDVSTPYQNVITLHAIDSEEDPITYSITALSPALAAWMNSSDGNRIMFAQTDSALNLTSLPATLDSNTVTVFVTCADSACSNFTSSGELWFSYSASSNGGSASETVFLTVQTCADLDACGTCMGDSGQCQCACYHGFTADFMDYTLFKFLLEENIQKLTYLVDALQPLTSMQGPIYRWAPGYQYTDYTRFVEAQKEFTNGCLDPYCDSLHSFENDFYDNLAEFYSAPSDFNTCSCDQSPPDTESLPPVYSP